MILWSLHAENNRLISCEIISGVLRPVLITILRPQVLNRSTLQTDRQTTCCSNIALCVASRGNNKKPSCR